MRKPVAAVLGDRRGDEVAVRRLALVAGRNDELAPLRFLVDRHEPAAAGGEGAEDAEHLRLVLGDDLDDAAAIADVLVVSVRRQAEQRAVADARHRLAGPALGRHGDDDARRGASIGVPLGRRGDKLAVAVAAGDVGEEDGRQPVRLVQRLAAAVDGALGFEIAEHLLQPDAVAAADAEGARDLALADLAGGAGDIGGDLVLGGEGPRGVGIAFRQLELSFAVSAAVRPPHKGPRRK